MQLRKLAILMTALCASAGLGTPLVQETEQSLHKRDTSSQGKKVLSSSKPAKDIETISSLTTLVSSYLDQISLSDSKESQYINPFLSQFVDLTSAFEYINDDRPSVRLKRYTSTEQFQLCTSIWQLIYMERNLMSYLGSVSATFVQNGATKNIKKAIESYNLAASQYFGDQLPRLIVCRGQLDGALEDFEMTLNFTRTAFS